MGRARQDLAALGKTSPQRGKLFSFARKSYSTSDSVVDITVFVYQGLMRGFAYGSQMAHRLLSYTAARETGRTFEKPIARRGSSGQKFGKSYRIKWEFRDPLRMMRANREPNLV